MNPLTNCTPDANHKPHPIWPPRNSVPHTITYGENQGGLTRFSFDFQDFDCRVGPELGTIYRLNYCL